MLKVVGDKYGIDKVKRIQEWVTWTAGRRDPFPLTGSLDPKVLHTVSTVLMEGKAGGPKQSGKHWKALAAWLTESQAETEHKRLGLEGTLNQRETPSEIKQEKWKLAASERELMKYREGFTPHISMTVSEGHSSGELGEMVTRLRYALEPQDRGSENRNTLQAVRRGDGWKVCLPEQILMCAREA